MESSADNEKLKLQLAQLDENWTHKIETVQCWNDAKEAKRRFKELKGDIKRAWNNNAFLNEKFEEAKLDREEKKQEVKQEMASLRQEMGQFKQEVKQDMVQLKQASEETNSRLDQMMEMLCNLQPKTSATE